MPGLLAMPVAGAPHPLEALGEALGAGRALAQPVEAEQRVPPPERHDAHAFRLARTPADGITGGDVQTHAPGPGAIEYEPPVHLEEREVRADEDRVVRGVLHLDLAGAPPGVDDDRPVAEQDLAGFHRAPPPAARPPEPIGCSTWSTRMPSPNRHSILT